nr:unnamed protein product [Leishmania braziliensis]CAJ2480372.1 unnamed protein product [Leishmania braziliensis]
MSSRPCAMTTPSHSSRDAKYAALLAGLERSCQVAPATDSRSTPQTGREGRLCAAPPVHVAESPDSFLALSSSGATDLLSASSSFASYSPLAAQRRSERASAAARAPSALFEVRVHRRRRVDIYGGTRQDCKAFTQNMGHGHLCALLSTSSSIDAPMVEADLHGTHSYSTCAAAALQSANAQRPCGAGSGTHTDSVATRFRFTSDDYLSYYLAHYGDQFSPQSSCPNHPTVPSMVRRDDLHNGAPLPASELSDFSETLLSIGSSMRSCAALPLFGSIPGCSPIVASGGGAQMEAAGDSDVTHLSSPNVACRLFLSPNPSLSHP